MGEWNHRICERCWFDGPPLVEVHVHERARPVTLLYGWNRHAKIHGMLDGDAYRQPSQIVDSNDEIGAGPCCYCGGMTVTLIYVRQDENETLCRGRHDLEQYEQWSRVGVDVNPVKFVSQEET